MKCNFCSTPSRCHQCPYGKRRKQPARNKGYLTAGDFMRAWVLAVWWRFATQHLRNKQGT